MFFDDDLEDGEDEGFETNLEYEVEDVKKKKRVKTKKKASKEKVPGIIVLGAFLSVILFSLFIASEIYIRFLNNLNETKRIAYETALNTKVVVDEDPDKIYSAKQVAGMIEAAKEQGREEFLLDMKTRLGSGESLTKYLRPLYPDDLILYSGGKYLFIPIDNELPRNDYKSEDLVKNPDGELTYVKDGAVVSHKGIDVSKYQGDIDWQAVKDDGVEFVIIRCGIRGYESGALVEDEKFKDNVEGALGVGLETGVYFYTQAMTEDEAVEEAEFVRELLTPYNITGPVVCDVERTGSSSGRMNRLDKETRTQVVRKFCDCIASYGYSPMIYHNTEMALVMIDLKSFKDIPKWYAYYDTDFYYPYEYDMWQYSESGRVNGIEGDVDINIRFTPNN